MSGENARTPDSGTSNRTIEKEPTVEDEARGQASPEENVLTDSDRQDEGEDSKRNPNAPQHGGFARPV